MLGKTSTLNKIAELGDKNKCDRPIVTIQEPLSLWESIYLDDKNLVELLHQDSIKYAQVFCVISCQALVSLINGALDVYKKAD